MTTVKIGEGGRATRRKEGRRGRGNRGDSREIKCAGDELSESERIDSERRERVKAPKRREDEERGGGGGAR
eukprot:753012-Hanusia_phi.AAC.11